jgi:hypothetical protein
MPNTTTYLVFSNPVEGKEEEFNKWYDNVHLPEVLATPGMRSAQRYALRETEITHNSALPKPTHRYLLVYELEGDPNTVMAKVQEAALSGKMHMSDALDVGGVVMSFWTPMGAKRVKEAGRP